jgi:Na+-translocating ferredoxin:NAD+ oxidoreductase RnfD subunit
LPPKAQKTELGKLGILIICYQSLSARCTLWSKTMEYLFIPLVVMSAPVLIVLIVLRYRYVQAQARYSTLVQLADKGVELSPQLLLEQHGASDERRRGLVLLGGGLGLMAMFLALPGQLDNGLSISRLWGIGLLPLMTGLGYLASWWLNRRGDMRG